MDFLGNEIFQNNWFVYGISLMIGVPLMVVLINELIYILKRKNDQLSPPLNTFKNIVLPLIATSVVLTQVMDYSRSTIVMKLLETFIWILIINVLLAIVNVLFFSGSGFKKSKAKVPQLFLDIFRVVMVLFGAAIVLSVVWGADLGGLVTALGLGSFVIGLALQDTLGNLFSGIALVYEKPFSEGDYIEVEDQRGRVIEMNWRAIRLETREKELIVIPHLVIGQGTIKNFSKPTNVHIMKTEIGFAHHNPPNKVKETLLKVCEMTPGILADPEPEVKTNDYTESKVLYEIEFAIGNFKDHEDIMDDFKSRVWYAAGRNGLVMPMSQMMIHHHHQADEERVKKIGQLEKSLSKLPEVLPIDNDAVKELLDGSEIQYYGRGEKVIEQGDPTGALYVIMEGKATMETHSQGVEPAIIGTLHAGDFFGEISLFTGKFSTFSVTVEEDVRLITIFPDEVMEMVELNPKLAQHLDEMMDARRAKLKELES